MAFVKTMTLLIASPSELLLVMVQFGEQRCTACK